MGKPPSERESGTVRSTGAENVILLAGVQYANSFSRFRSYAPRDPSGNLAASWHIYNFMLLTDEAKWDARVALPTAGVPLVATEVGEDDCQATFLARALSWLGGIGWPRPWRGRKTKRTPSIRPMSSESEGPPQGVSTASHWASSSASIA